MPKSKRAKIVNLTKTDKKGREVKDKLFEEIRECADKYAYIYVFEVLNMRNTFMKEVRADWTTSRFFLGRNKVMAKALGTTEEEEYKNNLHYLASKLTGNVGLMFTDSAPEEVRKYFANKKELDFARGGAIATQEVVIPAGQLMRGDTIVPHNMEPQLRKLGMPTTLVNGAVMLKNDYTVCKEGDTLTPEQAHILKHFDHHLAEFHLTVAHYYHDGKVVEMDAMDA
ncbi:ribosomal protein L10-domain-containing protein [Entophlyctis helioformis]|nr:ribosomal protein L10-domain-containing protein [Entophlyctis helioformis]